MCETKKKKNLWFECAPGYRGRELDCGVSIHLHLRLLLLMLTLANNPEDLKDGKVRPLGSVPVA